MKMTDSEGKIMRRKVTGAVTKRTKILKSPTYSYESHEKWGSYHCRALRALHEKIPPTVCGVIGFRECTKKIISEFQKTYCCYMRKVNKQNKDKIKYKSAMFGVYETTESKFVHMHFLARHFEIIHLENTIKNFNKKHKTTIEIMDYDTIQFIEGVSAYPFKFNYKVKVIFIKGSLNRYTFQQGNYFLGMKKQLEREGFLDFIVEKSTRGFDMSMLCCAEEFNDSSLYKIV